MGNDTADIRLGIAGRLVAGVLGTVLLLGGAAGMAYALFTHEWLDALLLVAVVALGVAGVRAGWHGRTRVDPGL